MDHKSLVSSFYVTINWFQFFDVSVLIQFNYSFNIETEMDSSDVV